MISSRHLLSSSLVFCLMLFMTGFASPAFAQPVTLTAKDGVKVFGTYYGTGDKSKPVVLLFHMAGSNAAEYAPTAPRLVALGYNALAIDQRSGGFAFGAGNQTVKELGRSAGFLQALPDLEAALAWVVSSGHGGKVIIVGSSYSASLVFLLAAQNPGKVAGLAAFSPGEYFGAGASVKGAAQKLQGVQVFVSSASDSGEVAEARSILEAVPGSAKTQLAPKRAPHGASSLRQDANGGGQAEVWEGFTRFLASVR